MKAISGKQFCRILTSKGWELKRVSGSHHIYTKAETTARISVPVHGNTPLKIGLQSNLMKITGIQELELSTTPTLKG